jgi:hypothetical protein
MALINLVSEEPMTRERRRQRQNATSTSETPMVLESCFRITDSNVAEACLRKIRRQVLYLPLFTRGDQLMSRFGLTAGKSVAPRRDFQLRK